MPLLVVLEGGGAAVVSGTAGFDVAPGFVLALGG